MYLYRVKLIFANSIRVGLCDNDSNVAIEVRPLILSRTVENARMLMQQFFKHRKTHSTNASADIIVLINRLSNAFTAVKYSYARHKSIVHADHSKDSE